MSTVDGGLSINLILLGAVAGNVIFSLGGKDNSLGNIGKIILDNIISGKFRRDVSRHHYY